MATRESLDYYLNLEYPARFIADPEGGYVVLFPDLPGCLTQGDNLEEAAEMAEDARRGWIEAQYELGRPIPSPSHPEEYSGKFNVRLPRSLHQSLVAASDEEGVSLNQYVSTLLARGDAQARLERGLGERLDRLEDRLNAIHVRLARYQIKRVPDLREVPRHQSDPVAMHDYSNVLAAA